MASKNPDVRRNINRRYAQSKRGQEAIARGYDTRLAKARALIEARKSDGCEICGRQGPPYIFDFHHIDRSQKLFNVSSAGYHKSRTDLLEAEMDKCVVLCAICHRMVEYGDLLLPYKIIQHVA